MKPIQINIDGEQGLKIPFNTHQARGELVWPPFADITEGCLAKPPPSSVVPSGVAMVIASASEVALLTEVSS